MFKDKSRYYEVHYIKQDDPVTRIEFIKATSAGQAAAILMLEYPTAIITDNINTKIETREELGL